MATSQMPPIRSSGFLDLMETLCLDRMKAATNCGIGLVLGKELKHAFGIGARRRQRHGLEHQVALELIDGVDEYRHRRR